MQLSVGEANTLGVLCVRVHAFMLMSVCLLLQGDGNDSASGPQREKGLVRPLAAVAK